MKDPTVSWYRERKKGVVEVDLYKYHDYRTTQQRFFCCASGIRDESETYIGAGDGLNCRHITFVISKKKPSDGICNPIWRNQISGVSIQIMEAYAVAAGDARRAWYWLEYTE